MENFRRKLRNKNSCAEIDNIFNPHHGERELLHLIPPHILKKIGTLQKVSCNTIDMLPELTPHRTAPIELEQCQEAELRQQLWDLETKQNAPQETEKFTRASQVKQEPQELQYLQQSYLPKRKRSTHQQMAQEMEQKMNKQLWKDSSFLQNLNDFLTLDHNKQKCLFMNDDFFQR